MERGGKGKAAGNKKERDKETRLGVHNICISGYNNYIFFKVVGTKIT